MIFHYTRDYKVAGCSVGGFNNRNKTQLNIYMLRFFSEEKIDTATGFCFFSHGAGLRVATSLFRFATNWKAPSFVALVTGAVVLWSVQMAASGGFLDVHSILCILWFGCNGGLGFLQI